MHVSFNSSVLSALALAFAMTVTGSHSALAQQAADDPCVKLNTLMQNRMNLIEHIQGFKEKKPTAQEACSAFTKLSSANKSAVDGLQRDGAWCRAPESIAASLKTQQDQIDQGKAVACNAAVEQKKMQNQQGAGGAKIPNTGPLGGTGDVLGGPVKLPQGAL